MKTQYTATISLGGHLWATCDLGTCDLEAARAKAQTLDAALRMWRRDRGWGDLFVVSLFCETTTETNKEVW